MAAIVFIIICGTGLFTTRTLLRGIMEWERYSKQMYALTAAFGFGITWWLSFLLPVAIANDFKIEIDLFLFSFYTALGAWVITYIIFLLFAHFRRK